MSLVEIVNYSQLCNVNDTADLLATSRSYYAIKVLQYCLLVSHFLSRELYSSIETIFL